MAIAVRVLKASALNGLSSPLVLASDYAVPAGAALVLIGCATNVIGDPMPRVTAVSDSLSSTWGGLTNVIAGGQYSPPQVFSALALNVSAGTPTVTATFGTGLLDRASVALLEITGLPTSDALDKSVNHTVSGGTSITTPATGALSQAANVLVACFGGWIGTPNNPGGWSSVLTQANGAFIGAQISTRIIDDAASRTETFTAESIGQGSILMLVLKQAAGAALRYKFEMDTTAFTSADTGIVGFVWKNATPDTGTAQKFTGLAGDATAGKLLIDTGLPTDVALSDTIYGIFYNDADTSGLITGTVEAA